MACCVLLWLLFVCCYFRYINVVPGPLNFFILKCEAIVSLKVSSILGQVHWVSGTRRPPHIYVIHMYVYIRKRLLKL